MKVKLLKTIRKNNPIYFDSVKNKYHYKYNDYFYYKGELYKEAKESKWTKNVNKLLKLRREIIKKEAAHFFNNVRFAYKRKRKPTFYKYL